MLEKVVSGGQMGPRAPVFPLTRPAALTFVAFMMPSLALAYTSKTARKDPLTYLIPAFPAALMSYNMNCMGKGGCRTWSWLNTGLVLMVGIMAAYGVVNGNKTMDRLRARSGDADAAAADATNAAANANANANALANAAANGQADPNAAAEAVKCANKATDAARAACEAAANGDMDGVATNNKEANNNNNKVNDIVNNNANNNTNNNGM